jgi:transcriptional regulator
MGTRTRRDPSLPVIQGTLDVLILKALGPGPQHGYGISAWIRGRTDGDLDIEDGALYQALHRLAHRQWIEAEWGVSDNNRRARFYRLTLRGRRELRAAEDAWRRYARAVSRVLDSPA